jgi:ribosomal protein L11 methyltransferase
MIYSALTFTIYPATQEFIEMLIALLDECGFEGIFEEQEKVIAYISQDSLSVEAVETIATTLQEMNCKIVWTSEDIPEQNWNEVWESNFEPVLIDNRCVIRASFHPEFSEVKYRITIDPKMSFGTGHHQTTRMMLEKALELDFTGKNVLDMGCGTGVLAILSSMKGAKQITAIDNDKWAVENTIENVEINQLNNIEVIMGSKENIPEKKFDIIFANINRNILLDQLDAYAEAIVRKGLLLISGILVEDNEMMKEKAEMAGFHLLKTESLKNWLLLMFERK